MRRSDDSKFERSGDAGFVRIEQTPYQRLISSFFGVVAAGVVWVYLIPGLVAYFEGVYTTEQIETIVKGRGYPGAEEEIRDHAHHLQFDRMIEARMETAIAADDLTALESLTKMKEAEETRWARRKPKAVFAAFEHNIGNILWLVTYVALGLNLVVIDRGDSYGSHWGRAVLKGLGLFVLFGWPNWLRYVQVRTDDRVVFSWSQPDVALVSSMIQELRFFVWCVLICRSWSIWLEIARGESARGAFDQSVFEPVEYLKSIERANGSFHRWQVDSCVVGAIFLPITYSFWYNVVEAGDIRYLDSAVVFQLMWGLTWLIASLPLVHSLSRCSEQKMALAVKALDSDEPLADDVLRRMMEMKPLDQSKVLASLTASILSFVLPLLQIVL